MCVWRGVAFFVNCALMIAWLIFVFLNTVNFFLHCSAIRRQHNIFQIDFLWTSQTSFRGVTPTNTSTNHGTWGKWTRWSHIPSSSTSMMISTSISTWRSGKLAIKMGVMSWRRVYSKHVLLRGSATSHAGIWVRTGRWTRTDGRAILNFQTYTVLI